MQNAPVTNIRNRLSSRRSYFLFLIKVRGIGTTGTKSARNWFAWVLKSTIRLRALAKEPVSIEHTALNHGRHEFGLEQFSFPQ